MRIDLLSITALLSFSGSAYGQDLISILNSRGFELFAADLQRFPDLLARVYAWNDVIVFAPGNEVVAARNAAEGGAKLHKRADAQTNAFLMAQPEKKTKRQAFDLPDSNFQTLQTFLVDPVFVNLGPQVPQRIVRNEAAPVGGSLESAIEIRTGLGDIVNTVNGSFKYDQGIIYGIDR